MRNALCPPGGDPKFHNANDPDVRAYLTHCESVAGILASTGVVSGDHYVQEYFRLTGARTHLVEDATPPAQQGDAPGN